MDKQQNTEIQESTVSAPVSQQVIRKTKIVTPQSGSGLMQKEYDTKK